jgi:hypothetical protein
MVGRMRLDPFRSLRLWAQLFPLQRDQRLGEGLDAQKAFGSNRAVTRIAATPHTADENQPRSTLAEYIGKWLWTFLKRRDGCLGSTIQSL